VCPAWATAWRWKSVMGLGSSNH